MARPQKELDENQIYELAAIYCSMKEIAAVMDCSVDTLERRFAEVIDKGREDGKMRLRRAQFKCAMDGNCTMLIWLGKQLLGQKESLVEAISAETLKTHATLLNQIAEMQKSRQNMLTEPIKQEEQ